MVEWVWRFFFFFKQKTAYEMRISDWSSDVCSSDLAMFCRIRWQANDYGTIRWQLMVMQACTPLDAAQRIPGVQPSARLLLHAEGANQVRAVLDRIDAIEALCIPPVGVSPAYWRPLPTRLSVRNTVVSGQLVSVRVLLVFLLIFFTHILLFSFFFL